MDPGSSPRFVRFTLSQLNFNRNRVSPLDFSPYVTALHFILGPQHTQTFRHVYHFGVRDEAQHPQYQRAKAAESDLVRSPSRIEAVSTAAMAELGLGVESTSTVHCSHGFHLAGAVCVPDQGCSADTCSRHGFCNDLAGAVS